MSILLRIAKGALGLTVGASASTSAYILYSWHTDPVASESHSFGTAATQTLLNLAMKELGRRARKALDTDCAEAAKVNEELLLGLLRDSAQTVYGRDHGLARIKDRDEFRQQHPLTNHEDYAAYIERVLAGEANVLFPGDVKMIAEVPRRQSISCGYIHSMGMTLHTYYDITPSSPLHHRPVAPVAPKSCCQSTLNRYCFGKMELNFYLNQC